MLVTTYDLAFNFHVSRVSGDNFLSVAQGTAYSFLSGLQIISDSKLAHRIAKCTR